MIALHAALYMKTTHWYCDDDNVYVARSKMIDDLLLHSEMFMVSLPSQVILSTNIAESSVTVPDVKYGTFLLLSQFTF